MIDVLQPQRIAPCMCQAKANLFGIRPKNLVDLNGDGDLIAPRYMTKYPDPLNG